MITFHGRGISKGIVWGPVFFVRHNQAEASQPQGDFNAYQEVERYRRAREQVYEELEQVFQMAYVRFGKEQADIFRVHQAMLEDQEFINCAEGCIVNERMYASQGVATACKVFENIFAQLPNEYLRERSGDLREVTGKVLQALSGIRSSSIALPEYPVIVAAKDLLAADVVTMDPKRILGFFTKHGGATSHLAILARTMSVPFVSGIGEDLGRMPQDIQALVDGSQGTVILAPSQLTIREYSQKKQQLLQKQQRLEQLRRKPCVTKDGTPIHLYADISRPEEMERVLLDGAEGIGIFRSEFFFMNYSYYPDEETQFRFYRRLVQGMHGRRVVVRTLDAGADKPLSYLPLGEQPNPALGMRAVRLSLRDPQPFVQQLRALLRAGAYGNLSAMVPMVISVGEMEQVRGLWERAKRELEQEGQLYEEQMELGVMIETPAAAMTADLLAPYADFFSIGMNDLTQYTLAVDRTNPELAQAYQPSHPAVLRLIESCVEQARRANIPVQVCGTLSQKVLVEKLARLKVDAITAPPGELLERKALIRSLDLSEPGFAKAQP